MKKISAIVCLTICASLTGNAQSFELGVEQFEKNNLSAAQQTFNALLPTNGDDPEIIYYLGRIEFELENFSEAVEHFEKAADLDSDNSHYYMWLGHAFGRSAQNASVLRQAGYARKSRRNYEKAIELDPANIEARESAMEYYLQAPRFVGGGRDKAEAQANEIDNINKEAGIIAWGRIYTYYDEVEFAEYHYKNAIEQHPEFMGAYYQLFNFYFNRGEYPKAADMAIQQLQVNDTTATIYYNLGNAQQRYELYDQAFENYKKALEIDENFNITFYQIGRLAAVSGMHLDSGKEYIHKFIALGDEVGDSWLAWAYYRLGSIEEHENNIEQAKASYQQALTFDSEFDEAKNALAALN